MFLNILNFKISIMFAFLRFFCFHPHLLNKKTRCFVKLRFHFSVFLMRKWIANSDAGRREHQQTTLELNEQTTVEDVGCHGAGARAAVSISFAGKEA